MKKKNVNRTQYSLYLVFLMMFLSLVLAAAPFLAAATSPKLIKKAEKIINSGIEGDVQLEHRWFPIPADPKATIEKTVDQGFMNDGVDYWHISRDGAVVGHGLMDDVKGKILRITFLVVYDKDGVILFSRIVKYRERHGSEVQNKRWLRQFKNRKVGSGFKLGDDIDSISGATISSRSVSRGVHKLTLLLDYIKSSPK